MSLLKDKTLDVFNTALLIAIWSTLCSHYKYVEGMVACGIVYLLLVVLIAWDRLKEKNDLQKAQIQNVV